MGQCTSFCTYSAAYSYFFNFLGGIRCGELGGVMHGKDEKILENDHELEDDENGELLRLAIPRRTYTESHMK